MGLGSPALCRLYSHLPQQILLKLKGDELTEIYQIVLGFLSLGGQEDLQSVRGKLQGSASPIEASCEDACEREIRGNF